MNRMFPKYYDLYGYDRYDNDLLQYKYQCSRVLFDVACDFQFKP